MYRSTSTRVSVRCYVCWIALLCIVGCSSTSGRIIENLDPLTSATVTRSSKPLFFFRDNPSQAAYARKFLELGPIAVNRSGSYRYYLWVSTWGTAPSAKDSELRDRLESIVVFADAEPLNLDLVGWTPSAIGASEPVYVKPFSSAVEAYYEVTIDQIRFIANSGDVHLSTGPSQSDSYEPWDDQRSALETMLTFVDYVAR